MRTHEHSWPWLPLALGVFIGIAILVAFALGQEATSVQSGEAGMTADSSHSFSSMSDQQWRERLTPEQYRVLRKKGTERAFTGQYWNTHTKGVYRCAACGQILFSSDDKYNSGTGWPSFTRPANDSAVAYESDSSLPWEARTEVHCSKCGGHLGHVFNDGPAPTGKRFCMNSVSLKLDTLDTSR